MAAFEGGAIAARTSTVSLDSCTLLGNKAVSYMGMGGALSMNTTQLTLNKVLVANNRAGYGGGICAKDGSTVIISDTAFKDNRAFANISYNAMLPSSSTTGGGAISIHSSVLSCSETSFIGNRAEGGGRGGAIDAPFTPINISWSAFGENTVVPPALGSAIYICSATYRLIG